MKELPELPETLSTLNISKTQITELPEIPSSLQSLIAQNTPLIHKKKETETMEEQIQRWRYWRENTIPQQRAAKRAAAIQEELVAAVFHPNRIQKLLDSIGIDLMDCI